MQVIQVLLHEIYMYCIINIEHLMEIKKKHFYNRDVRVFTYYVHCISLTIYGLFNRTTTDTSNAAFFLWL